MKTVFRLYGINARGLIAAATGLKEELPPSEIIDILVKIDLEIALNL